MKLVIFDLDQTLVDSIAWHDAATARTFHQFFGVSAHLTEVDFAGRSLGSNFTELAQLKGIPRELFLTRLPEVLQGYDRNFAEKMPSDATKSVLAGAVQLLAALSRTDNLLMLYTGDSRAVARSILQATRLDKYFPYGFYGTEVSTRVEMVRQAVHQAAQLTGKLFSNKEVVIIGDSLRDIECAKEINATVIAVVTGFHTIERLKALQPDFLFKNLGDWKRVLQAIARSS